ncbi:MAG: PKD domain-containing protein [Bacteroidota bacterium]
MKKNTYLKTVLLVTIASFLLIVGGCKKDSDTPNQLPVVTSVQVTPSSVTSGTAVSVNVSASDADEDELTYIYNVSGGSISGSGSSVSWTTPSDDGVYTVNVIVSDGIGEGTGSGQVIVEAPENSNPVVNSVLVNPGTVEQGGSVTITVNASDSDGDQLTYQYQVTGGAISGSGSTVSWTAPSQSGAFSVTVTVTDGNGGQATSSGSVTVNQAVTQITGTASFPAGSSGDLGNAKVSIYTSYENWNINNPLQYVAATGTGSNVTFSITNMPAGIYYLDVWKDNDNSASWSAGDYVGWFGDGGLGGPSLTEISIVDGETKIVSISMMTILGSRSSSNLKVVR